MRSLVALGGLAAGFAGLVWWRRRAHSGDEPAAQLGLEDGSVLALERDDPRRAELESLAGALHDALSGET
jgi:hypothetical protein